MPPSLHPKGYVLLFSLVFFAIFLTVAIAFLGSVTTFAKSGRVAILETQALVLAEAGFDKAVYELNQNGSYTGETGTMLGAGSFTTSVTTVSGSVKRITSVGTVAGQSATVRADVSIDTSVVSFNFGVQVGAGGVQLDNNARIEGNLYSNGSVTGANGATITGSATAASTNTISQVSIGGSARARTLSNCTVAGNAVYQTISSCSVSGTQTSTTTYASVLSFPITSEQIDEWKAAAEEGGTTVGNVSISGSQSLGPRKIQGDLIISGTLTLTGPVWVTGSITLSNNAQITLSSSLGNAGTVLIADSLVTLSNNAGFSGNGQAGSYPLLMSLRTSGTAISLSNGADGIILYAPYATVAVSNNGSAKQITAYGLTLDNNAVVTYTGGLSDAQFTSGPGGSWVYVPGSYAVQ